MKPLSHTPSLRAFKVKETAGPQCGPCDSHVGAPQHDECLLVWSEELGEVVERGFHVRLRTCGFAGGKGGGTPLTLEARGGLGLTGGTGGGLDLAALC